MKRAALIAMLFLVAQAAFAEKWYEFYNRGVKAVNAKNYDAAVDALQRSIAEMPNEATGVRARNEIIVYLPHFWLGIAKFNTGDVDGALREWHTSEEQGVIQNTDYYARMREWVGRAQTEKQRMAQNASADARKAADALVSRAMSMQMDALAAGGDRSETYRQGQRRLQEAIEQFNKSGTDSNAYHRAGQTANQARDLFATAAEESRRAKAARPAATPKQQQRPTVEVSRVQVEVQQQKPQPEPAKPQPQVVQDAAKTQPKPAVSDSPAAQQPPIESEALVAARVALQEYRGRAASAAGARRDDRKYQDVLRTAAREAAAMDAELQKKHDAATIRRVVDFVEAKQRQLDALTATAAPVAAANPVASPQAPLRAQLESAYRSFARGDLNQSEELLTTLIAANPTAEAFLLRGCTRYTRALLSRSPQKSAAAAADDFRSALKLNSALRLQKNAFSPKLVAYFDSVRTGRAQ